MAMESADAGLAGLIVQEDVIQALCCPDFWLMLDKLFMVSALYWISIQYNGSIGALVKTRIKTQCT